MRTFGERTKLILESFVQAEFGKTVICGSYEKESVVLIPLSKYEELAGKAWKYDNLNS